jgi:hypothetical protein
MVTVFILRMDLDNILTNSIVAVNFIAHGDGNAWSKIASAFWLPVHLNLLVIPISLG